MKDSEGSTGKGRKRKEKKGKKESSSPRCNTLIPPGLRRTYSYSTKTYSDKIPKTPQRQDTQAKVGIAITKYDMIAILSPRTPITYLPVPESESAAKRKQGKEEENPGPKSDRSLYFFLLCCLTAT